MADEELEDARRCRWADETVLIEGYRTAEIEFEIGQATIQSS